MTDSEIKKALECCSEENKCKQCPYYNKGNFKCLNYKFLKDLLDLINRQDFKIHQLEKQVSEIQNANLIDFKGTIGNYKAENESLKAEIERLKKALKIQGERLGIEREQKYKQIDIITKLKDQLVVAKAEAYKEFAERFVQKAEKTTIIYVADTTIQEQETGWYQISIADFDNLLKEKGVEPDES